MKASPIFEPLHLASENLIKLHDWPDLSDMAYLIDGLSKKIVTHSGKLIRFVPQKKSVNAFEAHYEARIYLTGEVQTRLNNWHDFFNALVWVTYPKTKAALNQLHFQALFQEWQSGKKQRGPLRDAVTIFDESGVVVVCSDANLIALLKNFEWKVLFWEQRMKLKAHMKFFVFGHGLYEKALNPYVGMTGKGIIFPVIEEFFSQPLSIQIDTIDIMLSDYMRQDFLVTTDLTPIPVLGYPGWSPNNREEVYYDNHYYFRPIRRNG